MPGVTVLCDYSCSLASKRPIFQSYLDSLRHRRGVTASVLWTDDARLVGATSFAEYPLRTFSFEDVIVHMEGYIYNKSDAVLRRELPRVADVALRGAPSGRQVLRDWIKEVDGDFVLVIISTRDRLLAVVSDLLGRLPLYYLQQNRQMAISRDLAFFRRLDPTLAFDRIAIAETLLLLYPLGARTLFDHVMRLPPGSLVRFNATEGDPECTTVHEFNFEEQGRSSIRESAGELAELFREACATRAGVCPGDAIISLSGGLDSRAVAAALDPERRPCTTVTCVDTSGRFDSEVSVAREVAGALGLDWALVELPPPTCSDASELLRVKSGLNGLEMSFILAFLRELCNRHGYFSLFTGDGGDKALPDLRPSQRLRGIDNLVESIVRENSIFSLNTVAELVDVDAGQIRDDIRACVTSYPEHTAPAKYVHFIVHERGMKWLFEGEDRNRHYCWPVSPFYGAQLFRRAMEVPQSERANYRLYREFLEILAPTVADVRNANWGFALGSPVSRMILPLKTLARRLPPSVRRLIRGKGRIPTTPPVTAAALACLEKQLQTCAGIRPYLATSRAVAAIGRCDREQLYALWTVVSVLEFFETGRSTLEEFGSSQIE